ncbi:YihY family inner membrane protein [bacterium]|nr:YihY family inner membrane protein [bacterium]
MNLAGLWTRTRRLIQHDIWHLPEQIADGRRSSLLRLLRIVVLTARGYGSDSLHLRASALTYYSLLSVVPTLALAFGIAKGFGLEAALERTLHERLAGQQMVLDRVIEFSRTLLANTRGGIVAGAGVAVLMWSAVRLLTNVETSFNAIWGVERARTLVRRLTDYLAIAILAPLLFLASSSVTVLISGQVEATLARLGIAEPVSGFLLAGVQLLPYVIMWLLLSLLYVAMPNTAVSWRAGLAAGVVSGTLFQIVQFVYLQLVINVARYNAVYGSFAALPLFLIWLHMSWLIVLVGAEVSFAVDNAGDYARERAASGASHHRRRLLAVRLAMESAGRFARGERPATAAEMASRLGVPVRLAHSVLHALVAGGILAEVRGDDRGQAEAYQPARDPGSVTMLDVARAFDQLTGKAESEAVDRAEPADPQLDGALEDIERRWHAIEACGDHAEENRTLAELAAEGGPAGGAIRV